MHIAVLIYGRLNKCREHFDNIMDTIGREHQIDFFASSDNSPQSQLNDLIELYKPISYTNDPVQYTCDLGKYEGKKPETNIHNMTCHFINKQRVFSLLEKHIEKENIHYDAIISFRVDILCYNKFPIDRGIRENTIYIPLEWDWADGINDLFAYGNFDVMKKYNNLFLYVTDLLERKITIPHPENLNRANLELHKINIQRFPLSFMIIK
jgi:hypothetical protein